MKSSLIILAFNEIEGLKSIFPKIPLSSFDECFAIDPGSTDGTREFLLQKGIKVINQDKRGRGEAFRIGAKEAEGQILVFFSPDGNEDPQDAVKLKEIIKEGYDMAVASRFMKGARSENFKDKVPYRDFGNRIFTFLVNLFFGGRLTDCLNGLRAVNKEKFLQLNVNAQGFAIEFQMSIKALKARQKIKEIPTIEGKRIGGRSTAKSIPVSWKLLKVLAKEILSSKAAIILFLCFIQLFYSFLFFGGESKRFGWRNILELNSYKGYAYGSFDNSVSQKLYPYISNYKINDDASSFILLAHDFPQHYLRGHLAYINRPLFPFVVNLLAKPFYSSYSITFCVAAFLNFVIFFFTVYLFYLLIKGIISSKTAFMSSILLIFSPLGHIWIVQPGTEILGNFIVISVLYMLYKYALNPSSKKLAVFSLLTGVLMLGKMILALPLFIFLLAIIFKKYKQGMHFLILSFFPFLLWYLFTALAWNLDYSSGETAFKMFISESWIFRGSWMRVIIDSLPAFFYALVYGFLLVPLFFVLSGYKGLNLEKKNLFVSLFVLSFFLMFFAMNYYSPRHAFLIYPAVYPLAVLGIEKSRFKYFIYALIIILSSINIFNIFPYAEGAPWCI